MSKKLGSVQRDSTQTIVIVRVSFVYRSCIVRISFVYRSYIVRVSFVFESMKGAAEPRLNCTKGNKLLMNDEMME